MRPSQAEIEAFFDSLMNCIERAELLSMYHTKAKLVEIYVNACEVWKR